ncbi:DJ-1/PfpI family protein [Chitinophaga sp. LS1]|uniref:DJ-1/PfpI family protein n=1 Tax=Chitinophaga sp. LS1 TaxID=3051176 RepID=UPI002AAC47BA|nr:DJ-1/PfpI family protein [Chitinophaga sp. LS1]WPV67913.1 DJ-1/PfpI family protein [Chitinophaga sp. LS1]
MKRIISIVLFTMLTAFASAQTYICPPCNGPSCDTLTFTQPGKCPHCGMKLIKKGDEIKKLNVCFYLYDGIEVLDFAGPLEVFSYAGCNIYIVSKTTDPLHAQGVLKVLPTYSIENAPPADIFVTFGGNDDVATNDPEVIKWIQSRIPNTKYFMSVCTGAFILGKAGILDHKTVTTFHNSIENLRKALPNSTVLADKRFVEDGNVLTTAGISAGIDGALHLVEKLRGHDVAIQIAKQMEYDKWVPGEGLVVKQ